MLSGKLGLERKDLLEIINKRASGSGDTKVKTPLLMDDPYKPAFTLNGMLKDILLAQDAGASFPFTDVPAETFQSAKAAGPKLGAGLHPCLFETSPGRYTCYIPNY